MAVTEALSRERALRWIAVIALIALVLRIAGAGGALWLDEAWSAVFAHDARTPLGVFQRINHDNNHHLNSIWLQWVGLGAPPRVARAVSILTGTAAVIVAGLIGTRRSPLAGILTALLFALSPAMVTLGSEARGYAPMMLCLLVALWQVDRWLGGDPRGERPLVIALCCYIGTLSQLTMVFGGGALIGWALLTTWRREGLRTAMPRLIRMFGPSVAAFAAALLMVFGPSLTGRVHFVLGGYEPFTFASFRYGLTAMAGYTFGVREAGAAAFAMTAALLAAAGWRSVPRLGFHLFALLLFPLALAVIGPLNAGNARYYWLVGFALLLLWGDLLAALLCAGGWRRALAAAALALFALGSVVGNRDLIVTRRGDTAPAIRALAARAPAGTTVLLEREAPTALLTVAAAEQGYRLAEAMTCPARPFLFLERSEIQPMPAAQLVRCGAPYRAIASARTRGMSGQSWTLYERVD